MNKKNKHTGCGTVRMPTYRLVGKVFYKEGQPFGELIHEVATAFLVRIKSENQYLNGKIIMCIKTKPRK